METTTYDYEYSSDSFTAAEPCEVERVNYLGAQLSTLYYFMFLFSLFSNGLVLIIIHRFEKLNTVTNILLLNLVLSSLIFMSSLPFIGVYTQVSNWVFGKVMCKIVGTVYYLGFYSSVLFLTLLTFDRHLAVVYSLGVSRLRSRRYAVASCAVVWLVSGLACIRPMILHTSFKYLDNTTYCQEYPGDIPSINVEQLRTAGFYLQLILFLIFPLVVIIYCYARITITVMSSKIVTKFKTVRLIFVIVLMFFMCWTPFNIVMLMEDEATTCEGKERMAYAREVTRVMAYTYFCISPLFYTFVGKKFQNYFRQMLVKRFPGLEKHVSVRQHSKTNLSTKSTRN
ncbi:C-C chemokine receptor type 3-like [Sebastes umbrosus]|uniref:C-C chemokine receptor type 3-like n=1 Tax=Sebastes umbrosus TaxID=72105 RepID=UPI00189DA0C2|nr:C-C chemokine receptor type 3-like [Sebastes umbrosus]XP_037612842.1 C-C chemokine receptor type 3-like [Sebastes umbrosus]